MKGTITIFEVVGRKVVPFEEVRDLLDEIDKLQEKINNLKLNIVDKINTKEIKILEEIISDFYGTINCTESIIKAEKYLSELYTEENIT